MRVLYYKGLSNENGVSFKESFTVSLKGSCQGCVRVLGLDLQGYWAVRACSVRVWKQCCRGGRVMSRAAPVFQQS